MNQQTIGPVSPFFIVRNAGESATYYVNALGFELRVSEPQDDPFFVIVGRGSAQFFLKAVSSTVQAQPNPERHEWAPWDAFVYTASPDSLLQEFASRDALIHQPLHTREDGLTGFEVSDPDGYVLFFGCPE